MAMLRLSVCALLLAMAVVATASDPDPLQDFCVADFSGTVVVNGAACKPASTVTAADFLFSGFRGPANTNNKLKSGVIPAAPNTLPGLNTQGISLARIDLGVGGLNPPHTHPRATEVLYVQKGTVVVGFVAASTGVLYQETLQAGDVFAFPRGLLHFQRNVGKEPALLIAALNSQFPGAQGSAAALFGSTPSLPTEVLQQAFGISAADVNYLISYQKSPTSPVGAGSKSVLCKHHSS